ncbi:DNRLRE domain-containing protein [Streptosporangium roseum]|uniref:DNRLRE domain-containing protein n=1 Tax=Streptosporangium roseum TaxID=2001 RepID=UPI0034274BF1
MIVSLAAAPSWAQQEPTPPPVTAQPTPVPKGGTPVVDEVVEAAKKKARTTGKRVEIPSQQTESTTVFANPDGKTLRMELHAQPIRVKKAKGDGFTPIDTTLIEDNGVIKPKAIKGDLTLSAGENTALLKSKTERGTTEIAAPGKLAKPKLTGNTATYASAYGEGVDLVITATATGFRQKIVIRERPSGPVTFRLPVDLPKGMSYGTNAAGQPTLLAEDGKKTVAEVRPALVLDAVAADGNGPIDAGKVGKAPVSAEQDGSALVFTPDSAFLANPAVTYPVTVMAADSDWWEPALGNDTFVNSDPDGYPNGYYNSSLDRILVGKSNDGGVRWRGYIRFDEIPADSPLRGGKVDNADLTLWNYLSNDCGLYVGSGITARRITERWDVSTLTWSNQPLATSAGADTEYGAYSTNCSGSMNYAADLIHSVNEITQAWADGEPNYGFQLTAGNESDLTNWRRYRSQEQTDGWGAHGPQLTVDFTPAYKVRVVFSSDEDLSRWPTYEEALPMQVDHGEGGPELGGITLDEANIIQRKPGAPYEVGPDKLQLLPGEDWSGPDPEDIPSDEAGPIVIETSPTGDAIDVPADVQVKATFDKPVRNAQLTLKDSTGAVVAGSLSSEPDQESVIFAPAQPLSVGTKYTAEVSGAQDLWDNIMTTTHSWSFTTLVKMAGHWTFDEANGRTATDASGQGHDAKLNDTAVWIAGKNGSAISNAPSQAETAASRQAVSQNKQVEVADETTETTITHAQPDGKTFTTEIAAGPVRTKQNGAWVPIDVSLAEQGGLLKPKALAAGAMVEVSTGGTGAFVKMTAADGQSYALRWPTTLPKPVISKNVATFADAAGRGADLVVTVLPTGFRHDVVLRERPAAPLELRIGVETGGLTLAEGKGGRLLLTSDKGKKLVASAPQPVMWDASAKGRLPQARHAKIATDVVTTGDRTELVLKPDHVFLSDPATVYPVRVDPTTTLPFNHDVEVATTNTTGSLADPTAAVMMAGTRSGQKYRVHLRFDTAALTGATVSDAKLSLNNIDAPACGAAVSAGIQARRLTGAWDENNLYWANKPASTTEDAQTNTAGINESCATWPGSMDWNVTGIAQDWAAGAANHGLVLQSPTETNVANYRVFTAAEDTDFNSPPKLTVTTTSPASAPTISALTVTPAQDVAGVTTVTSLTPQLAATVADPIGGSLTGEFEIEHDPAATGQGTGQIWTGASAAVASGTQATATIPAGKLTDGWKVRWRARAANASASTTSAWSAWQMATIDLPGPISNPTVGALQVNPSQVVDGMTVTSTLTPSLLAQVSDPAGGSLRAEYELEHDPAAPQGQGAGQIWAGAVDNVASGTQASAAVPAGKLSNGWKVRWRARAVAGQLSSTWADWQQVTIDVVQSGEEPLAQTAGPVIRTDHSFTAAAWLRWNDKDGDYTVIEQKGTHQAPFRLGNTPDRGLVFTFTSADTADATIEGVLSDIEPPVNEWFHLVGVYDATAKTATLYLNGSPIKTGPVSFSTWNADAAMTLGTSMRGDLDDVRAYPRPLTAAEIAALLGGAPTAVKASSSSQKPLGRATGSARSSAITASSNRGATALSSSNQTAEPLDYNFFTYDRLTVGQCNDLRKQSWDKAYSAEGFDLLKPYTACWSKWVGWGDWEVKYKNGRWQITPEVEDGRRLEATVVMQTYLGDDSGTEVLPDNVRGDAKPRQIAVWTSLNNFAAVQDWKPTTAYDNDVIRVEMKPNSDPDNSSTCVRTDGDDRRDTIENWKKRDHDLSIFQSTNANLAKSRIAACTLRPWLIYEKAFGKAGDSRVAMWNRPEGRIFKSAEDNAPKVRCDSKARGGWKQPYYKNGCVFLGASALYTMYTGDPNNQAVAQHIHDAYWKPDITLPKRLGGKQIPGNWDDPNEDTRKPLTYLSPNTWVDGKNLKGANKAEKDRACATPEVAAGKKPNYECDEFPFASTHEGAGAGTGQYSVRYIDGTQNGHAGTDLRMFYARYRIDEGMNFWVRVHQGPPPS